MKTRLWTLYRTLLNNHYGFSAAKFYYIKKRQRTWEPLVIVAHPRRGWVCVHLEPHEQLFIGVLALKRSTAPLVSLAGWFFSVLSAFTSAPT